MNKLFSVALLFFISVQCIAQNIDPKKLDDEISNLNDVHKYEVAIIMLEDILLDSKSSSYDKYNAYLQKYLTYKRLYNYSEAENNLNLALAEGLKSQHKEEVKSRVLIEKIFINFDLQQFDQVEKLIATVSENDLKYIISETRAFYMAVVASLKVRKKDYHSAEVILLDAVKMLENENPKHLPNIYRKLVDLYDKLNNPKKAIEAYEMGLFYANKYQIDIYKIIMYETITKYYTEHEDYKNALIAQKKVSEARSKYNAANKSGSLTILEKQLLQQRKNYELQNNNIVISFLVIVSVILIILIIVLLKLYKVNKSQGVLIEKENYRMRAELKNITEKGDEGSELSLHKLSSRQLEIINLVKQGKTNKEIGALLFISENTVKYHLKIIYDILDIEHRSELK
jgi:DNA-binding CsgD family transcriptional regulator